jgi:hypothetical protein
VNNTIQINIPQTFKQSLGTQNSIRFLGGWWGGGAGAPKTQSNSLRGEKFGHSNFDPVFTGKMVQGEMVHLHKNLGSLFLKTRIHLRIWGAFFLRHAFIHTYTYVGRSYKKDGKNVKH